MSSLARKFEAGVLVHEAFAKHLPVPVGDEDDSSEGWLRVYLYRDYFSVEEEVCGGE